MDEIAALIEPQIPALRRYAVALLRDREAADDALSYSIWHGIAAHRPLGNVNRARRDTYAHSAAFRGQFNGCPVHQPRALADLP